MKRCACVQGKEAVNTGTKSKSTQGKAREIKTNESAWKKEC